MEQIPPSRILKFKPGTLEYLRKQYGYNTVKNVNEAIDLLDEWTQKQEHFEKKSFDRGYLERLLIYNKGSVEKCKRKLDKLCTLKTFVPDFFAIRDIEKELIFGAYSDALLSNMTPDYGRVYYVKLQKEKLDGNAFMHYSRYFILGFKYIQMVDYCNHLTVLVDWGDVSGLDYVMAINVGDLQKSLEIGLEGFSMRLKAIHMFSCSTSVTAFVTLLKQILGKKLGERIYTHKTLDTLFEFIPKEILPREYGGEDKSILELRDDLYNEITSAEFTEYRREMNKGRTNETLRKIYKFNEDHLGMPGTFRNLSVD